MAQATFLCSAGIRVLLQYNRQMKGKGLKSGLPVVVGEVLQQADKGKGGSSPFTPHFFHRSANKPGK